MIENNTPVLVTCQNPGQPLVKVFVYQNIACDVKSGKMYTIYPDDRPRSPQEIPYYFVHDEYGKMLISTDDSGDWGRVIVKPSESQLKEFEEARREKERQNAKTRIPKTVRPMIIKGLPLPGDEISVAEKYVFVLMPPTVATYLKEHGGDFRNYTFNGAYQVVCKGASGNYFFIEDQRLYYVKLDTNNRQYLFNGEYGTQYDNGFYFYRWDNYTESGGQYIYYCAESNQWKYQKAQVDEDGINIKLLGAQNTDK